MTQQVLMLASDELAQSLVSVGMASGALSFICAGSPGDLLTALQEQPADAILLELETIPGPADELLGQLRADTRAPIMVLAEEPDVDTVVEVLGWGADECLDAALSVREILTHLRAQIRRATQYRQPAAEKTRLVAGPLEIDLTRHAVTMGDRAVALTPREFDLLAYLACNAGRVVPRQELVEQVWHGEINANSRSLDVHIGRLRTKIERDPQQPTLLVTVAGVGYRLDAP